MTSIRSYILWGVIGILFTGMTVISYLSYQDATHEVEEIFDAQLTHTARILNGLFPDDLNEEILKGLKESLDKVLDFYELSLFLHDEDGSEAKPSGHVYENKLVFQVWNQDKQLLIKAASAPLEPLSPFEPGYTRTVLFSYRWRVFGLFDEGKNRWLFVAEREDVRGELVKKIAFRAISPILFGLPVLAIMLSFCVGKGLSPLTRITKAIRKRNPRNLKAIVEDTAPDEIKPLVTSLNHFMKELDETLDREKHFTADAAHELRTPLSVLKIHAQNAFNQVKQDKRNQSLAYLIQGIDRSTRVVDQLLNLSGLEHDLSRVNMEQVDMKSVVVQVLRDIAPLALQRKQELGFDVVGESFMMNGDEVSLSLMTRNLVHNAIHYSPPGASVTVILEQKSTALVLKVIDEGPGIPEKSKTRIFERFYRVEPGRTTGAGLGLSIVNRVLKFHDAGITLEKGPNDQGLCVSIVFSTAQTVSKK